MARNCSSVERKVSVSEVAFPPSLRSSSCICSLEAIDDTLPATPPRTVPTTA